MPPLYEIYVPRGNEADFREAMSLVPDAEIRSIQPDFLLDQKIRRSAINSAILQVYSELNKDQIDSGIENYINKITFNEVSNCYPYDETRRGSLPAEHRFDKVTALFDRLLSRSVGQNRKGENMRVKGFSKDVILRGREILFSPPEDESVTE